MDVSDDHFSALSAPPTQYLGQSQQYAPDLDRQFGNMLCELMANELTAADAISQLQEQTGELVQYYRCVVWSAVMSTYQWPDLQRGCAAFNVLLQWPRAQHQQML